jgi:uncharacterized membrane protein YGL010W
MVTAEDHFLERLRRDLQRQHSKDLQLYQSAHRDWRNRVLHWILIPVECWSALLFSMILAPSASVTIVIGLALGCISLWIATKHWVGVTCFIFHGVAVWSCFQIVQSCGRLQALSIAGGSWTIAWMLQVGVGHWMWEQNQPNIANNNKEVSYLAMCQSVLIAWSS